jgi:hypothetical protein
MKLPRLQITVRRLMAAVFLVAVNIAFAQSMLDINEDIGIIFVTLPMANILVLAAPRVWSGDATRAFWIAFEVAGWFMVVFFGYLSRAHGAVFFRPANGVYPWATIRNPYAQSTFLFVLDLIFYTPPQVMMAWCAGWIAARYQRRVQRHSIQFWGMKQGRN